jgi:sugar lactone lactonase YvrE
VSGGTPVQVTEIAAQSPHESPDGKWLYFYDQKGSAISRRPGSNGDVERAEVVQVVARRNRPQYNGWAVTDQEVVFIAPADPTHSAAIRAYNPGTGKIRSILDLSEVVVAGGDMSLSVSKDGGSILYTQLDRSTSNIIVAENSR